uniref:Uncharacterized protein n=1 Tax=Panagrolaimus sp. PS1159 TaxID=55785 RepID=A0AC35FPM7_9BILA
MGLEKSDEQKRWQMISTVTTGVSSFIVDRPRGWKLVQKCLPRIIEYGLSEGILQIREQQSAFNITGLVLAAQENLEAQNTKESRSGDKVNLPTNDLTIMHEAIPFLPVPVALLCLFLNVFLPGSGTILSGLSALCMGQPRINFKEGRKLLTLIVNFLVGISQFFTITFLFVVQYREALQQRRQEAVATAAIEALTKDSILHRKDVKTLVKAHKFQAKEKDKK